MAITPGHGILPRICKQQLQCFKPDKPVNASIKGMTTNSNAATNTSKEEVGYIIVTIKKECWNDSGIKIIISRKVDPYTKI